MTAHRISTWIIGAGCVLASLFVLVLPEPVHAATLSTPAVNVLDRAGFTLEMAASDATGTAVLTLNGKPVASKLAVPGAVLDFGEHKLAAGTYVARVVVRSRAGVAITPELSVRVWGMPGKPTLISPTPGGYAAQSVAGSIRSGASTTLVYAYLNGKCISTLSARPGSLQSLGTMSLAPGINSIELAAVNPVATTRVTYKVTRLDFPWATCLIIDKSDCKMYWVRNGVLVKVYPIAVGKRSTQTPVGTWRIGAKYITGPVGIYGPRKMRMYRQTKSGFVFTAYNIHGTNQEWVIGTWASHGCIRMYNRDVLELYPQVPMGTMVQTRE